jgi:hypothetical protein
LSKIGKREKAVWTFVIFALLLLEIKSVYQDRNEHDRQELEARQREEANFGQIAQGIQGSILQSQQQFEATMQRAQGLLDTTQSVSALTRKNLMNITGGDSFAFVRPQVEAAGKGPIGLVVWNRGGEVLTGVTVAFSRTNDPNWGNEFFNRYPVGTIAPHDGAMIPVTITPQLGDNGNDHYWLMISAQNGTVDETLDFRESKRLPGTLAVRIAVSKRFKFANDSGTSINTSIPVLVRAWTDEGGEDQKLPSVDASLKLLRKNAKKIH